MVTRKVRALTGDRSVRLTVTGGAIVTADPQHTVTPADITVNASQGKYNKAFQFFAPGAVDGVVTLPVTMSWSDVTFQARPLNNGGLQLSATGPSAPPVSVFVQLSSNVTGVTFRDVTPVPMNFTPSAGDGPLPSWIRVDQLSGTTPTRLRITANPAGLTPNTTYYTQIQVLGPAAPRFLPVLQPSLVIQVQFAVGQPAVFPTGPYVISTPSYLPLRVTSKNPSVPATVHLASSGDAIDFTIDPTQDWLTISPMSGKTPADLAITASAPLTNAIFRQDVQLRFKTSGSPAGFFSVSAAAVSDDYVGYLTPTAMSSQGDNDFPPAPRFALGALFDIGLDPVLDAAVNTRNADPGAIASSLGGYSFKLGSVAVPLLSYTDYGFLGQIPVTLQAGAFDLDAFDVSGRRVATAQITLNAVAPKYLESLPNGRRVQKQDGLIIDDKNPVQSGDSIRVKLTGQGSVNPPLATGFAASPSAPSKPLQPVYATVGGKPAEVVSASMSASEVGILEVQLLVPNLIDGEFNVSVRIGDWSAGDLPLKVQVTHEPPQVNLAGIVNVASLMPQIAPGTLFGIFGSGLAETTRQAVEIPLSTNLGGVSVRMSGMAVPLLFISPEEIIAQAPYEVIGAGATTVSITVNGGAATTAIANLASAAPGIFESDGNRAIVSNENNSVNSAHNGAAPGTRVIAYLTGADHVSNPVPTGSAAPDSPPSHVSGKVVVTVNGVPATLSFATLMPGDVGLTQIGFQVPDLPPGSYPVVISISDQLSNSALITVR